MCRTKRRSRRFACLSALATLALLGAPSIVRAAEAGGLSLRVTEVTATKREGQPFYDSRLGNDVIAKLKKADLAYNSFQWKAVGTARLTVGSTERLLGKMFVELLPTAPNKPDHAALDVSIKDAANPKQDALHTQTFLMPDNSVLFHIPAGTDPPSGTIYVLSLSGTAPPPPAADGQKP